MADELVLIVDDNEKNLKLARDVLRFAGFRTLEAASGAEGVALAARAPARRDPDGHPAAGHGRHRGARGCSRSDPRTAAIPVVALTSLAMKGDREWFLAAGFDGYLEKPISVREFPDQVRSLIS